MIREHEHEQHESRLLTWKFHGSEILSSSADTGDLDWPSSEAGLFAGDDGDLGLRFANLKKPGPFEDLSFFWRFGDDATEDTRDIVELFGSG
jgi:hypothetical protein